MIDSLFTGKVLGHESDIADGSLRGYEFRSLANIVGDYYVSPRFLDAVAVRAGVCGSGLFGKLLTHLQGRLLRVPMHPNCRRGALGAGCPA